MKHSMYLLSVIIPTKDRQRYALAAIKQTLDYTDENVQIVVQDNSEKDILEHKIEELKCMRIKYHRQPKILSFIDNFDEALSLADGRYLCMIGDDDGVLPSITKMASYADKNQIDAVIPSLNSVYVWPMEKSFIRDGEKGYLCISYLRANIYNVDPKKGLIKLLKYGGQNYQNFEVPRIYHGLVSKEAANGVKQQVGRYFGGLSPDIYMATALSFVCNKVVSTGFPITVSGICPGSGSSNSATGKHTGELKDAPHFIGHSEYNWSREIPAIYTVETIWADTMLHAIRDLDKSLLKEFNISYLLGICNFKYPQFKSELKDFRRNKNISGANVLRNGLTASCFPFVRRCFRRLTRKKSDVKKFYNVPTIKEAADITCRETDNLKLENITLG